MTGYGREIFPRNYYYGDFLEGKYHGHGTKLYSDGSMYVGAWKDHKKHGIGKLTKPDGSVEEGNWVENVY